LLKDEKGFPMRQIDALVRFYKALADSTRLQLVQLLAVSHCGNAKCVSRLAQELGVTASSVSQHLRILKDLGLVQSDRRGYQIHYWLDANALAEYQKLAGEALGAAFVHPTALDHLKERKNMCGCSCSGCQCEHPERQQDQPTECTPEQIRECHGDVEGHPCEAAQAED
jgi:ArsR family transcriptional regulator, arsenate/arsenite/antimonite-responsive transcriptional repressor